MAARQSAGLPDIIEIPLDLSQMPEGAVIDVLLSSSGQTVWPDRAVKLRKSGVVQLADLRIPFVSLQPYLNRPLALQIVERGHAALATYLVTFGK